MTSLVSVQTLLPPQQYARAASRSHCAVCTQRFSPLRLKHHCRQCGDVVCIMCYTTRPVNLPVVGLRRVKICASCGGDTPGNASASQSSASDSSGSSSGESSTLSRHVSARSLAARKLQHLLGSLTPIVVPSPSVQANAADDSGGGVDNNEALAAAWEIGDLNVHWVDARELEDLQIIGSGGNGVVWLVRDRNTNVQMAAKRLIGFNCGDEARATFVEEVKLVARLQHPRVVHFIGAAWTKQLDLQALFEFMPNGDLRRWLVNKTGGDDESCGIATTPWKLQIAIDVVDALAYVHAMGPPLVHRDVKSTNILLDENLRAKLTDFGVSRFQSAHDSMTTGVGTARWIAPEVLNGGGEYGTACDIYSFGVLLSELDTDESPYTAFLRADDTPLPEMRLMLLIAAGKIQPSLRDDCPALPRQLGLAYLSFEPAARPRAADVAARLRVMQAGIDIRS